MQWVLWSPVLTYCSDRRIWMISKFRNVSYATIVNSVKNGAYWEVHPSCFARTCSTPMLNILVHQWQHETSPEFAFNQCPVCCHIRWRRCLKSHSVHEIDFVPANILASHLVPPFTKGDKRRTSLPPWNLGAFRVHTPHACYMATLGNENYKYQCILGTTLKVTRMSKRTSGISSKECRRRN